MPEDNQTLMRIELDRMEMTWASYSLTGTFVCLFSFASKDAAGFREYATLHRAWRALKKSNA